MGDFFSVLPCCAGVVTSWRLYHGYQEPIDRQWWTRTFINWPSKWWCTSLECLQALLRFWMFLSRSWMRIRRNSDTLCDCAKHILLFGTLSTPFCWQRIDYLWDPVDQRRPTCIIQSRNFKSFFAIWFSTWSKSWRFYVFNRFFSTIRVKITHFRSGACVRAGLLPWRSCCLQLCPQRIVILQILERGSFVPAPVWLHRLHTMPD